MGTERFLETISIIFWDYKEYMKLNGESGCGGKGRVGGWEKVRMTKTYNMHVLGSQWKMDE